MDVLCADIDVDKTADAASVSAGEQIGFTVTLTNHGAGEAKGVQFTDVLPAGLTWTIAPANADWAISGGSLVYKPRPAAGNSSSTVHVIATTSKANCGDVDNTASVSTSNDGSDESSASVDVNCADDRRRQDGGRRERLRGRADRVHGHADQPRRGRGEGRRSSRTSLPAGLTWSISPGERRLVDRGGKLVYKPDTLAAGASSTVHVIATTAKENCGTVDNTATVTTSNDGPNESARRSRCSAPPSTSSRRPTPTSVTAGDQIGFTVKLSNTGEGEAKGIEFTDVLPAGFDWAIDPANADWSIADGSLVFKPSTMAGNTSSTVHVVAATTKEDCGEVDNTASVTTSNDGSDESSATVDVLCGNVDLEKVADADDGDRGRPDRVHGHGDQHRRRRGPRRDRHGHAAGQVRHRLVDRRRRVGLGLLDHGRHPDLQLRHDRSAGASKSVHITSPTTATSCGTVDNTASVTTSNDGSDKALGLDHDPLRRHQPRQERRRGLGQRGRAIGFTLTATDNVDGPPRRVTVEVTSCRPASTWSVERSDVRAARSRAAC